MGKKKKTPNEGSSIKMTPVYIERVLVTPRLINARLIWGAAAVACFLRGMGRERYVSASFPFVLLMLRGS